MATNRRNYTCKLEWCQNQGYAKGLCATHYNRQRQGLPFIDPRQSKNKGKCGFETCHHEASSKGLCRTHYMQQYTGRPLTPIRPYLTPLTKDGLKKCKTCEVFKDFEDDFYDRTGGGGKQAECKDCHMKRARRNQALRESRVS